MLGQQPFAEQVVREGLGDDIGANLCSPYYEPYDEERRFRRLRVLSPLTEGDEYQPGRRCLAGLREQTSRFLKG